MNKTKIILMLFVLFSFLVGCMNSKTYNTQVSISNASPQSILKADPDADIFIMKGTVYVNAKNIDWVTKLSLNKGKSIGKINKTGINENFQDWDATKLNINTEIYEAEDRNDIVLVKVDNIYIPYLQFVEG